MRRRSYRDAERHGKRAEFLCVLALRLKGYRVLAQHWKCPSGELDIVARRGRILAVVEVKARGDIMTAAQSLGRKQQGRIARAASHFLATRPDLGTLDLRFDVMLVIPWRPPRHLKGAWVMAT
jgi:putative endonuclease